MQPERKTSALFKAKPGKAAELESLLRGMVVLSRSEPGNLRYDLWQDLADPTAYVIDELYIDDAAVLSHRATSHFQSYLAKIGELASRTAVTSHPLDVARSAPAGQEPVENADETSAKLSEDEALDEALEETFPASDPISPGIFD